MLSSGRKPRLVPQPWTQQLDRSSILNVMKIPHFGRHQEVNACVKFLLSAYHHGYLWLDRRIVVDTNLITKITMFSMKGPNPQQYYHGKTMDKALAKRIQDLYGDVEKGQRGYKVNAIDNETFRFACPLLDGNLARKNQPTQVTGFVIDLAGKCVEGMSMNWCTYLVNELNNDCLEAQDKGYEFHFSWLLILIAFVAWQEPTGAKFPEIDSTEPLALRYSSLWYDTNMNRQWQYNVVFHQFYLQLKTSTDAT